MFRVTITINDEPYNDRAFTTLPRAIQNAQRRLTDFAHTPHAMVSVWGGNRIQFALQNI